MVIKQINYNFKLIGKIFSDCVKTLDLRIYYLYALQRGFIQRIKKRLQKERGGSDNFEFIKIQDKQN